MAPGHVAREHVSEQCGRFTMIPMDGDRSRWSALQLTGVVVIALRRACSRCLNHSCVLGRAAQHARATNVLTFSHHLVFFDAERHRDVAVDP